MKKLFSLLLCFLLIWPGLAGADESFQHNQRYNLIDAAPFFFVAPEGFTSEDGRTYTSGEEYFVVTVLQDDMWADFSSTYAADPASALEYLDGVCAGVAGQDWYGAMRKEISGGCWKISGLVQTETGQDYLILAACPAGAVMIYSHPGNTASGCDLEHGIFKTLACVEYQ
ncbi:MAG: hypothetical protein IJX84_08560 [Clostridia bacterium]|nr:hypothetical protein [Clostridia bacterium]